MCTKCTLYSLSAVGHSPKGRKEKIVIVHLYFSIHDKNLTTYCSVLNLKSVIFERMTFHVMTRRREAHLVTSKQKQNCSTFNRPRSKLLGSFKEKEQALTASHSRPLTKSALLS